MKYRTAISLMLGGRVGLLYRASRLFAPFYRLSFVASAAAHGLIAQLADGPRALDSLASTMAPGPGGAQSLRSWLDLGVRLGELSSDGEEYRLRGKLSLGLAALANDDLAALVEEVAVFHHQLIWQTPQRLRAGERWSLKDHDATLIARSSRIMEPFVFGIIDATLPTKKAIRILELGCGSGTYLRYAARKNPALTAVGLELQADVAAQTAADMEADGLSSRVTILQGDARTYETDDGFDAVTLYNLIYYFPTEARVTLFKRLRALINPGGRLILSSSCRGGSPAMHLLDLWMSSTDTSGPLPDAAELREQLLAAGFSSIEMQTVIPGEPYIAVVAETGEADPHV